VAHGHRVVIAAGEQRGARGRAQGGGVEAGVAQAAVGQPIGSGGMHRSAKRTGGTKADIVEHDQQDIGCAVRRALGRDGRKLDPELFRVERQGPLVGLVGNRKDAAGEFLAHGRASMD